MNGVKELYQGKRPTEIANTPGAFGTLRVFVALVSSQRAAGCPEG
jgi:hypothetical protein